MKYLFLFFVLQMPLQATQAWTSRGHATIATLAAYVLAENPSWAYLKQQSYVLGYYSNTPDFIWKKPETYKQEWYNHYMDLEIFERKIPKGELAAAFRLSRIEFEKKYPQVEEKAGRSWWRIQEFEQKLHGFTQQLQNTDLKIEERHRLQMQWQLLAGALGHYVQDLAQPLHVTENYDGQLTGQKGVHEFFEGVVVDELYPQLHAVALKKSLALWKKRQSKMKDKTTLELLQELSQWSNQRMPEVLKLDKKWGRENLGKVAPRYMELISDCFAQGAVVLAEIWRRHLDFPFNNERFYDFSPSAPFIEPLK